jgi:hypothetical protein
MKLVICVFLSVFVTAVIYNINWIITNVNPVGVILLFIVCFVGGVLVLTEVATEVASEWKD